MGVLIGIELIALIRRFIREVSLQGMYNYLISKVAPEVKVHHLRKASDMLMDYRFQPTSFDDLVAHSKFFCHYDKSEVTLDWLNDPELISHAAARIIGERVHMVPVMVPDDANISNFRKYENEQFILIRVPYEAENLTM